MKKQLAIMTTLACFAFASIPAAMAKPSHGNPKDDLRILKQLDLSVQQKQDIKTLIQQSRADNKVVRSDTDSFKAQMDTLMNMPIWDETMAKQLISEQITQSQQIRLNRAKTKHQIFTLLTAEQQNALQEKMTNKDKKSRKGKKKMEKRMAKKLDLSDAQKEQLSIIKDETKSQLSDLKAAGETFKQAERALIQSEVFDEEAWLALDESSIENMLAHRLIKTKAKYQQEALLTAEQKAIAKKMREKGRQKLKEKADKTGSI